MNKRYFSTEIAKDSLIHLFSSWGDNALPERFFALSQEQRKLKNANQTAPDTAPHNTEEQGQVQKH